MSNTLVILACSKSKLTGKFQAKDLYQGDIFKKGWEFATIHHYHRVILSAKHGIISPWSEIETYEKVLKTKKDILEIQPLIMNRLYQIISKNRINRVIIIGGKNYIQAILPTLKLFDNIDFILKIRSENGIFDMKKNINKLVKNSDITVFENIQYMLDE